MSHFTKLTAQIKDLEALRCAAQNMNLRLEENTGCRYYFGEQYRDHVLKLPGRYDAAIEKQQDGTYTIEADFYGGHVERYIGPKGNALMRQYTAEKLKIEAKKNGYKIFSSQDGTIKLIDRKSGGKAVVHVDDEGKIQVETSGFKGRTCMSFKAIEDALGRVDSLKKKPEFYQESATREYLVEDWS